MKLGVEAAVVDGILVPGDVELDDGRIARVGLASRNGRGVAAPGFVDLQVNGFGGIDFLDSDAAGYRRAGEALLETGVTAYLPTFITTPEEQLLAALREVPAGSDGPRILGVHLEGPFLSPLRLGIHPAAAAREPDVELLGRLLGAGPVRLVTLAPELPAPRAIAVQAGGFAQKLDPALAVRGARGLDREQLGERTPVLGLPVQLGQALAYRSRVDGFDRGGF